MKKKLILLSHICNIEYMGLVLWEWSFEPNGNAYSTKNRPFCLFTYCEKGKTIFVIVNFFFSFVVYFEQSCTYLNLSIFSIAKLNCCHEPLGTVQEHSLNLAIFSIARLNLAMNRAARFKSIWTLPYFQLQGLTLPYNFEPCNDKC